jgi:hypothetical protein
MTDKKTTFISFLLDETGSMEPIKDDTIGGFNAHLDKLKKSGGEIVFSLVSFNSSKTRKRYVAEPIHSVRPLTAEDYQPAAMTPLIDAAVKIIKATAEAVSKRSDDPNVVIVMQTDGLENVSVEYTSVDLAALVKEKERAGWQFTFLGAGLDAFAAARQAGLHLDPARVVSYGRAQSREVFDVVGDNLVAFAATGSADQLAFSDEQRERVGDVYAPRQGGAGKSPRKRVKIAEPAAAGRTRRSSVDDFAL